MAARINELKQKRIDVSAKLAELRASRVAATDAYAALLESATATPEAKAEAKTKARSFDAAISTHEEILTATEQSIHDAQAALDVDKARAAANAKSGSGIEVGRDNREDRPWAKGVTGLGQFCQAVRVAQSGGDVDPRLFEAAASGMGEVMGPDGAFAVPHEMATEMEQKMFQTGEILSRVDARDIAGDSMTFTVINSETSRADGSRQGGVLGYWVDEGEAPTATNIKTRRIEMKLRKVGALGYMTDELVQDAPALGGELQNSFVEELTFQVEDKIWEGSGAGVPLGIMNAGCLVSVAIESGQTAAGGLMPANFSKMWARMSPADRANAVWFINPDVEPQLDVMYTATGTYGGLEPRFVTYGPDGVLRIKGRPVVAVEYASSVNTTGDIVLANFSKYRLIRKAGGVQQASSIHVRFAQGEQTFRAFYRVDGQPIYRVARTPFKGSNTLSPFVALATRS